MRRRYNLAKSDNFPVTSVAVISDTIVLEDENLSVVFEPTKPSLVTKINLNFSRGNWLSDITATAEIDKYPTIDLCSKIDSADKTEWLLTPQTPLYMVPGDKIFIFARIADSMGNSSSTSSVNSSSSSESSSSSINSSSSQSSSSSLSSINSSSSVSSESSSSVSSESSESSSSSRSSINSSSSISSESSVNSSSSSESSQSSANSLSSLSSSGKTSSSDSSKNSSSSSSFSSSSSLVETTSSQSSTGHFRVTYEIHYLPLYTLSESETEALSNP